jgi:cell division septum initiation protein DivIVA
VALDRQSIERRDFPVGEHGYAPAAVDAHLSALATEVEQLKQTSGRSETLAASASGRVHAIIEAAETSAAEIQRAAEDEARGIRDQANHDAHAAREQANHDAHAAREQAAEEARGYLGRVSEATNAMMQRLDAIHQEFGALMEATRAGSARLHADVQQLEIDLARAREGVIPPPGAQAPTAAEPALGHGPEPSGASAPEAAEFAEIVGSGETISPDPGEAQAVGGDGSDDAEGARLIALNMALNGTPREETARYLSENFQLADAGGLLDEVYASVEG